MEPRIDHFLSFNENTSCIWLDLALLPLTSIPSVTYFGCKLHLELRGWFNSSYLCHSNRLFLDLRLQWLDLLKSMLKETEWTMDSYMPSMSEYMSNAYTSFALGPIVLPALYLVGPKLSEEIVHHSEYHNLFKLMSTCGRLLNDIHSYEVSHVVFFGKLIKL